MPMCSSASAARAIRRFGEARGGLVAMTPEAPNSSVSAMTERVRLFSFVALMVLAGFALRAIVGLPKLPDSAPTFAQVATLLMAPTVPLGELASVLVDVAWLLWL